MLKKCESCGSDFETKTGARTCGTACRNRLISAERQARHMHTKTCRVCDKEFQATAQEKKKQTCSTECGYKLRGSKTSRKESRKCPTCGEDFEVRQSQISAFEGGGNYCSRACWHERNVATTTRNCECCGKEFRSPPSQMHVRTCSKECGLKIRRTTKKEKVTLSCRLCEKEFHEHQSHADGRIYCSKKCMHADPKKVAVKSASMQGERNPAWKGGIGRKVVSANGIAYRRAPAHIEIEKSTRRKRAKDRATPAWANYEKVCAFYEEAQAISKEAGVQHHVDHIVPLTSNLVCGLHNEFNLQVIPGIQNLRKHNRHWPDMP